jgi:hypothetical protein
MLIGCSWEGVSVESLVTKQGMFGVRVLLLPKYMAGAVLDSIEEPSHLTMHVSRISTPEQTRRNKLVRYLSRAPRV